MKSRLLILAAFLGVLVPSPPVPARIANACSCRNIEEVLELEFDAAFAGGAPVTDATRYQDLRASLKYDRGSVALEIKKEALWYVTLFSQE